ncbi:MAG: hypothetical protein WDZ41_04555 [Candidatus Babeliales bacterium]
MKKAILSIAILLLTVNGLKAMETEYGSLYPREIAQVQENKLAEFAISLKYQEQLPLKISNEIHKEGKKKLLLPSAIKPKVFGSYFFVNPLKPGLGGLEKIELDPQIRLEISDLYLLPNGKAKAKVKIFKLDSK